MSFMKAAVCTKMWSLITVTLMQVDPVSEQLFLSDIMDQGIAKMLDGLDRVDMQIVNDTTDVNGEGSINGASQRSV